MVTLTAGLLVFVGLLAAVVAIPATFAVVGIVAGWLATDEGDPDQFPPDDFPVAEVVLAWIVSATVAILARRYGRRLLRERRGLVLFLRRFGYDDATKAVTFAARRIGGAWQLVTLDDAEIAPVGVSTVTRGVFSIGRVIKSVGGRVGLVGARIFPFAVLGMFGIVEILRARDRSTVADEETIDRYVEVFSSIMERDLPLEAIEPSLLGVFALCAMFVAVALVALLVFALALIAMLALSPFFFAIAETADEVRKAEEAKTTDVTSQPGIANATYAITEQSKKTFGPTLVVVRVASEVWQDAVSTLAGVATAPLIDVSLPTTNLAWELEKLLPRFGDRCLLVGELGRLDALRKELRAPAAGSVHERVAPLLRGREVLAYTMDRRGMRRFARALRIKLAAMPPTKIPQTG